jgi:hypothetical protein
MITFCNECGRYQGHETTCSQSEQVTIGYLRHENSLIRAQNERLRAWCQKTKAINDRLKNEKTELLAALRDTVGIINETGIASGICCCGEDMDLHENPFDGGHSAVDSGEYCLGPILESARQLINKHTGSAT